VPDCLHLNTQSRQVDRDDFPNSRQVDSQVIMDQDVSKSRNRSPVDLRMKELQSIADSLGRFGKSLQIPQDGVLNQLRLAKGQFTILAIPFDTPDAIGDVLDVKAIIPHADLTTESLLAIRGLESVDGENFPQQRLLVGPKRLRGRSAAPRETMAACAGQLRSADLDRCPQSPRPERKNRRHAPVEHHALPQWLESQRVSSRLIPEGSFVVVGAQGLEPRASCV
jgi:hypothetical protein